jgi:hypothetical protein
MLADHLRTTPAVLSEQSSLRPVAAASHLGLSGPVFNSEAFGGYRFSPAL